MTTESFVFVRRTPRALNMHHSSTRPTNSRRAGSSKRFINWTRTTQTPASCGVVQLIRKLADRKDLSVNLETVAQAARDRGFNAEHMPGSPLFRECVRITE